MGVETPRKNPFEVVEAAEGYLLGLYRDAQPGVPPDKINFLVHMLRMTMREARSVRNAVRATQVGDITEM